MVFIFFRKVCACHQMFPPPYKPPLRPVECIVCFESGCILFTASCCKTMWCRACLDVCIACPVCRVQFKAPPAELVFKLPPWPEAEQRAKTRSLAVLTVTSADAQTVVRKFAQAVAPERAKMQLCHFWLKNPSRCRAQFCTFAHGSTDFNMRKMRCFDQASCRAGFRCAFRHEQ